MVVGDIVPAPSTHEADAEADATVYWHMSFLTHVALGSTLYQLSCSRNANSGPPQKKQQKMGFSVQS